MDSTDLIKQGSKLFRSVEVLSLSIGVPINEFSRHETSEALSFNETIQASKIRGLSFEVISEAALAWGDAFECNFSSDHGILPIQARGSLLDRVAFDKFKEDVQSAGPDDTVSVSITINKAMFGKTVYPDSPEVYFLIYIFTSNLMRAFSGTLQDIEGIFFRKPKPRSVCLLLEKDVALAGPILTIVGPAAFDQRKNLGTRRSGDSRTVKVYEVRRDHVSWINFETILTPYHLLLAPSAGSDSGLTNIINQRLHDLILIHIANSARHVDGGYEATFLGASLRQILAPLKNDNPPEQTLPLFRLFRWAYSSSETDKLALLRAVITTFLGDNQKDNYAALDRSAQRIRDSSLANYATLIQGFVTRHFDKLKEVDKYVQETVFQLGGQISGLATSLTTSMLGTVGVTIGGFVAYVIDMKTTPKLLSFGTLLYGAYLFVFPLSCALLLQNLVQYRITVREFRQRIHEFGVTLNIPHLSDQYVGMMKSRQRHFWAIFAVSCVVYVLLVGACLYLYKYFKSLPATP
jgi:hypothetical protein